MRATRGRSALLRQCVPGTLRVSCYVYDPETRQYHPLPKRHIRISVDSVAQADTLWRVLVAAASAEVNTWPGIGESIDLDALGVSMREDAPEGDGEDPAGGIDHGSR